MFKPMEDLLDHPEALSTMPVLYATEREGMEDWVVRMRFYHPVAQYSWYAVEYDPEDRVFFGWADCEFQEWGYFSLLEMAFLEVSGVRIMWDVDFEPVRFGELKAKLRED
jgi:hypothetical protein